MLLRKHKITLVFLIVLWAALTAKPVFSVGDNWGHYERGLKLIEARDWQQAYKNFTYYLNQPEMHQRMFGVAYFGRGLLFQAMGQYDKAIAEFKLAIENDVHPEFSVSGSAYMNIGNIYFKMKSYKDAIPAYIKALEKNPGDGLAHYFLGLSLLRTGEYDKAEKEAEEARKLGVTFSALTDELKKVKDNPSKEHDTLPDK
jgi:tetratricopeptide (TPR) repeat protein